MKAVIQRVKKAKVLVGKDIISEIGIGFLVLLGVGENDDEKEAKVLAEKTVNLRIMSDKDNKMNLSVSDVNGEILVVSQFTLYGDVRSGRRPSFIRSAKGGKAEELYKKYIEYLKKYNINRIEQGVFGAMMDVEFINDGPVTIIIDTDDL